MALMVFKTGFSALAAMAKGKKRAKIPAKERAFCGRALERRWICSFLPPVSNAVKIIFIFKSYYGILLLQAV
ncbi:MAG: hypothetical protein ACOX8S_03475 [Christensenellales bacterium]